MKVRYIRDSVSGNNVNGDCHWTEIQAISNGINVALNKSVTYPDGVAYYGSPNYVTDGDISIPSNYFNPVGVPYPIFVQVDLGQIYTDLEEIKVWHYYYDGRKYHDVKTEVSTDGVNWITVFDSNVNGEYTETVEGLFIPLVKSYKYIRNEIYSSPDGKGQWSEIRAFSSGANVALNKAVTSSLTVNKPLSIITDGNDGNTSGEFVESTGYGVIEVDLGKPYQLDEIQIVHYWDGRVYGHKLHVSLDGRNWKEVWNTKTDGEYSSSHSGRTFIVPTGESNTSLELTRNNQSYVLVPHDDSLTINGPMTMEFWIKLKSPLPNDYQVILDKGNISTSQYYVIHEARNGNNQIKYRFGNGHERTFNRPTSIIGEWTHMAFVWDGSNMIFYENGEQIAFETFPVTFTANTMPLTFGRMSAGGAYLDGFLDNIRIWNIARSAEEINTNKDVPILGDTQGLIGLWEFNEGLGMIAYDSSVNGNHGTITKGTFSTDAPLLQSLEPPAQALPIKLGEIEVSNIFLGETPITKIYLGAQLLS